MIELSKGGAYLVDGVDVIEESAAQQGALAARSSKKHYCL